MQVPCYTSNQDENKQSSVAEVAFFLPNGELKEKDGFIIYVYKKGIQSIYKYGILPINFTIKCLLSLTRI